jgi:hypothetical protein
MQDRCSKDNADDIQGTLILKHLINESTPIPLLPSPLKGEEHNVSPPLQGEGKGGGGVNQMSIRVWTD